MRYGSISAHFSLVVQKLPCVKNFGTKLSSTYSQSQLTRSTDPLDIQASSVGPSHQTRFTVPPQMGYLNNAIINQSPKLDNYSPLA